LRKPPPDNLLCNRLRVKARRRQGGGTCAPLGAGAGDYRCRRQVAEILNLAPLAAALSLMELSERRGS
jgi:hypothetical protein